MSREKKRQSSAVLSAAARKARKKSPWGRGPHVRTAENIQRHERMYGGNGNEQ